MTSRLARRIEKVISSEPEVRTVFLTVAGGIQQRANEASVYVGLSPRGSRDDSQIEIMDRLRSRLIPALPEAKEIEVGEIAWVSFGTRSASLQYALRGPDLGPLSRYSDAMVERMRSDPGFVDAASSFESGKPEIAMPPITVANIDSGIRL